LEDSNEESNSPKKPLASNQGEQELLPGEYTHHPATDGVILLLTLGMAFLMIMVQGMIFVIPLQFSLPSFDLDVVDEMGIVDQDATQGNIAKAVGLVTIPRGLCSVMVSVFLFPYLTRRFGMLKTIATASIVNSTAVVIFAFWMSKVWHFIPFMIVTGVCSGFIVPAVSPLNAKYAKAHYPRRMAAASALPVMGMNLSNAFAQNLLALVVGAFDTPEAGFRAAWCLVSVATFLFATCFMIAFKMVESRAGQQQEARARISSTEGIPEKKQLLSLSDRKDPDTFILELVQKMKDQYQNDKDLLWHGSAQFLYEKRVLAAMPQLREWDDSTGGAEHITDLYEQMKAYPDQSNELREKFPQVQTSIVGGFMGEQNAALVIQAREDKSNVLRARNVSLQRAMTTSLQALSGGDLKTSLVSS